MASNSFKVKSGIIHLEPGAVATTVKGEARVDAATGKLRWHDGTVEQTVSSDSDLSSHIGDPTDAHSASSITNTPAGAIAATDVQAALNELDGDKTARVTSSTDNAVVRFDGITGAQQDSGVTVDDSNNMIVPGNLRSDGTTIDLADATTASIGTSGTATTVSIANGSGANVINIGGANSTVNITGTVSNQDIDNLNVTDKLITINDGGAAASGGAAGVEIEEDSVATAYVKTSSDRNSWELKAPNSNGIATLTPGSSNDSVALLAATQVLTNKDIDGGTAANTRRITLPKASKATLDALTRKEGTVVYGTDTVKAYVDNGTALVPIGSGSGGGRNYIDANPDAETDTAGWSTYADTAAALPVDGTGGSANITWTRTTTTPLRGTASFLLTKDAVNRQGNGVSYAFTIDRADLGKPLSISFEYEIASGTYATGDLGVYIYDVTNAVVIQPSGFQVEAVGSGIQGQVSALFQTATSSSSYRLILHVASTSASAYTVEVDNVIVGPQTRTIGPAMTDWTAYTPTFTGFGSPSSIEFQWRQVGDSVEIQGKFTAGTTTATEARVSLPPGLTAANTSKIPSLAQVGQGNYNSAFAGTIAILAEPSVSYVTFGIQSSSLGGISKLNGNSLVSTGNIISFNCKLPITGYSSNTLVSSSTDTRVVAMRADKTSGSQTSSGSEQDIASWNASPIDTHGGFNTTSGEYTVRVPGLYKVTAQAGVESNSTGLRYLVVKKNGTTTLYSTTYNAYGQIPICVASGLVQCVAGDLLKASYYQDSGGNRAYNTTLGINSLSIERLSGPSQIAASEVVGARITGTPTGTINGSTNNVYPTVQNDTHAAYNTSNGTYTVPVAGLYNISVSAGISFTSGSFVTADILRNGTSVALNQLPFPSAFTNTVPGTCTVFNVSCNTGDTINVRYNANGTPTFAAGNWNYFSISRSGGVM